MVAGIALVTALVLNVISKFEFKSPEQTADRKEWLVCCPECGRWQSLTPRASSEGEKRQSAKLETHYTNWYVCQNCRHRWSEEHRL